MISDDVEYDNLYKTQILDDCSSYQSEDLNENALVIKPYINTQIIKKNFTWYSHDYPQENNSCIFGKTNAKDKSTANINSSGILKKKFIIRNNADNHKKSQSVHFIKNNGRRDSFELETQKFNK